MINNKANFIFYNELKDFLPANKKGIIHYIFNGNPSVKDAIEAIGIPHVEIDQIYANDNSIDFHYLLKNNDFIEVWPANSIKEGMVLTEYKFILDVHLGKLAKYMRMLGFDTIYENNFTDNLIIIRSIEDSRIILTRDLGILKNGKVKFGYWIRNQNPKLQVNEVIRHFKLINFLKPFQRCVNCNSLLKKIEKQSILHRLEPLTNEYYEVFYKCENCDRVYWKGSHYEKMKIFVEKLKMNYIC